MTYVATALALSAMPHARRPPNVHFELVVHSGAQHGKELLSSIEARLKKRPVSVLAIENASHTRQENSRLESVFDQLRSKFNEWKVQKKAPINLQRVQAKIFAQGVTKDEFFQSIIEASLLHNIPIRVAEEYTESEGARIREMNMKHKALLERGAQEEDLERCFANVLEGYQIYRDITPLRDPAIKRAVSRLDEEFGQKGEVLAVFGEAHEGVPQSINATSSRPNQFSQSFQNRQADIPQSLEQFSARVVLRSKLKQFMAQQYSTEAQLENAVTKWEPLLEKVAYADFHRIAGMCKGKGQAEKLAIIQMELRKLQ